MRAEPSGSRSGTPLALLSAVASIAAVVSPVAAAAQERTYEWTWTMHPLWGMWGLWAGFMMLMMLAFWGVVIAGIIVTIRWLVGQGRQMRASDPALEILRQRYARGDITREEFEAKKRDLM